jgi:hypothetical protein
MYADYTTGIFRSYTYKNYGALSCIYRNLFMDHINQNIFECIPDIVPFIGDMAKNVLPLICPTDIDCKISDVLDRVANNNDNQQYIEQFLFKYQRLVRFNK